MRTHRSRQNTYIQQRNQTQAVQDMRRILLLVLALIFVLAIFAKVFFIDKRADAQNATPTTSTVTNAIQSGGLDKDNASSNMEALRGKILALTKNVHGDYQVYVYDFSNGESLDINSHQMQSASLMKLFVAGAYLQAINNGTIEETYLSNTLLSDMIEWSSNDAWVEIETILGNGSQISGAAAVTNFARNMGAIDTLCLTDDENNLAWDASNYTSAKDVGQLLKAIYYKEFVTSEASTSILGHMMNQQVSTKIPEALPQGIICANKTGELDEFQHDAAIIYGEKTTFALVIMSEAAEGATDEQIPVIHNLTRTIYSHLNQ